MTTEGKKTAFYILIAVMLIAVLCSAGASIVAAKTVSDMRAEAAAEDETREDNVSIMNGQYEILSTLPISDAYHSGNSSQLNEKQKETLEMASAVLDELIKDGMSDYEKEKAVYDWMSTKLTYDTGVLQVIPQTSADSDNPYGVLKYHNAVCVGYATTFRLFMQMMNIECMVVHNTDKYHSWDLVKLDNEWYHVDVYSDQGSGNYANFNMNDEQASFGHDWDREFFPSATGTKYNYAYQNKTPLKDIYQVPLMIRKTLEEKNGFLALDFETIDEAHAAIVEAMLNGIQSYMNEASEYSALWLNWHWMHITGNEYVLAVYINGYESDDNPNVTISEEDQTNIERAISKAFGADVDWDNIEASINNDKRASTDRTVAAEGVG